MPLIDLEINGFIRGVDIKEAFDRDGKKVDVTNLTVFQLTDALHKGDLTITFPQVLSDALEVDARLFGFAASRYRDRERDG